MDYKKIMMYLKYVLILFGGYSILFSESGKYTIIFVLIVSIYLGLYGLTVRGEKRILSLLTSFIMFISLIFTLT